MSRLNSHADELAAFWSKEILWNCPMARYSTFKVGGPAEAVVHAGQIDDLRLLIPWLEEKNITWQVIGRGSNILIPDEGLPGVVILLEKDFALIEHTADNAEGTAIIRAGAACPLAKLVHYATAHGLTGLEFAVGIPASVGGAIIMNAGAWGKDIAGLIQSLSFLNDEGNVVTKTRDELNFAYRNWGGSKKAVVLSGTFALARGNNDDIAAACEEFANRRRRKQPQGVASAGSFFKNPPGDAAGRLIDSAGFKGHSIGGAMVSPQHANFIVNTGNATARDIMDLMKIVQEGVFKQFGVKLESEVHILGQNN